MSGVDMTEQVMVRMTPDTLCQLQAASKANERTVSQTVRYAIRLYLAAEGERLEAARDALEDNQ